jgi:hypothetical protein
LGRDIAVTIGDLFDDPIPRRLAVYDPSGAIVAFIPSASHTDVQAILDTGMAIGASMRGDPQRAELEIRSRET